jgi:hypothetical protein
MFLWCEVIFRRLIVESEDALTGFTLEVRVNVGTSLGFGFTKL